MVWRYACGFFRILKLFFITGFLLQYLGNWYRTNGPLVNFTIFNTSNKNKAGDINSPWNLLVYLQLTLVISTPLISILSLMSNWFLSPDYLPYVFIVFQLRLSRTTFMSTLRLSRPSFSVPKYIFLQFLLPRISNSDHDEGKKNVRCGVTVLSVNENHTGFALPIAIVAICAEK